MIYLTASEYLILAEAQRGLQDGGAAPPGPAPDADKRDRHQSRL